MVELKRLLLANPFLLASAMAFPPEIGVFGRAIGDKCRGNEGAGTCQTTSNCRGISYPQPYCPSDPNNVQCCVEIPCTVGTKSGYCRSVSNNGCPGGSFDPGNYCPGSQDIQCCLKNSENGTGTVGERVLAKAMEAAGVPYAWWGGSCSGPTGDAPPSDFGEIGFDCSGLVCWALCQTTGRDLFSEGLRNTRYMYCETQARLGYAKYPFSQRKKGDAVFFGDACDCSLSDGPGSIHHVGLVMEDGGDMMWNAPNDDLNRVMALRISAFGETPCPYVIRFT
ncbi:hypothetical protein N657DRAFT_649910 [Parathielavia appendiculata]|uniref:NlpC/P60 domain-containing protein n=1 Tax=Parathielavia appendiculata TaxID=2587402 RepID=A0AAN6TSE5_9PEZI|nr:hypothetical protein N657DRAFT_649910 [Parathielavia appendiculata]